MTDEPGGRPRKPTDSYGTLVFGKDGRVRRRISKLPDVKEEQEHTAIQMFADLLRQRHGRHLLEIRQLDEANQDFAATEGGRALDLQLTELVKREFAQPHSGAKFPILFLPDGQAFEIDEAAEAEALLKLVQKKIAKGYSRRIGAGLWLVVFSTCPYHLEYSKDGEDGVTEALARVRSWLERIEGLVFDEVWFTDLQTRPVKVWPLD